MAQLKSGSTVGGQTIATTAQAGAPTGSQQVGSNQVGFWLQSTAYNIGYQRAGSQIQMPHSFNLLRQLSYSQSWQSFQAGTWRAVTVCARGQTTFDENSSWINNPSLWVRVS